MSKSIERCYWCSEPTDKAGPGEDSIYLDSIGPFCERCYDEIRESISADYKDTLTARIAELERDRARWQYVMDNAYLICLRNGTININLAVLPKHTDNKKLDAAIDAAMEERNERDLVGKSN